MNGWGLIGLTCVLLPSVVFLFSAHAYRLSRCQLLKDIRQLDQERAQILKKWSAPSLGAPELIRNVQKMAACVDAARHIAAQDWGWVDSCETLQKMDWRFEKSIEHWLSSVVDSTVHQQWLVDWSAWEQKRQQALKTACAHNRLLQLAPMSWTAHLIHWPLATAWMSERQHALLHRPHPFIHG